MDKVKDFYTGFEGNGEISFFCQTEDSQKYVVKIWEGYFYTIMTSMLNNLSLVNGEFTGIAYYYNRQTGWYDESPWLIENLGEAIYQFECVNDNDLDDTEKAVLESIVSMLKFAYADGLKVFITYD